MVATIGSSLERRSVEQPIHPNSAAQPAPTRAAESSPANLEAARRAAEDAVFARRFRVLESSRAVVRHIPVVGRPAVGLMDRLDRNHSSTPWVEPKGIKGWEGALEPKIEWAAKNGPAGKRETWGPMFGWGFPLFGSTKQNHWAVGGCLEKLDRISGSKAQRYQSEHRRRSGHHVLKMALGFWDAFNAGHCNQEAMREGALKDPQKSVTREVMPDTRHRSRGFMLRAFCGTPGEVIGEPIGACFPKYEVTFTPTDIKLLLMLVMENLVTDDPTQLQYLYEGFRNRGSRQKGDKYDPAYDPEEPYPHTVIENVCKNWGAEKGYSIIGDKKPGKMLDNRVFDGGRVEHLAQPPQDFDRRFVPSGGQIKFYSVEFDCSQQPEDSVRLKAWVHTAEDGTVSSGWVHPREHLLQFIEDAGKLMGVVRKKPSKDNVDFFWVPQYKQGIFEMPWTGFATKCNPDVDMFQVWSIYQDSLGNDWARVAAAPQHRDAVFAHLAAAKAKGLFVQPLLERVEEAKRAIDAELAAAAAASAGPSAEVPAQTAAPAPASEAAQPSTSRTSA